MAKQSRAQRVRANGTHAIDVARPAPAGIGMPRLLRARELDRDAHAFLRYWNLFAGQPLGRNSLADLRPLWRFAAMAFGRGAPVARVQQRLIDGPGGKIELRLFAPRSSALIPGLLWCHGGGFIVGDLDACDAICRSMAKSSGAMVVAARYRLAPEHDLDVGREDCLAALRWLARNGPSIGIDPTRLAIGGDSAGGNIAAAVAQECTRSGPALRLQVLAYPATELLDDFPSKEENARDYLLTAEGMSWIRRTMASSLDLTQPWLSPARSPDLRGLPAALVVTAGFDPIRDDGLHYVSRLRAAGVPVELLHYAGQFHGFLNFDSVLGAARDGLRRIGRGIAAAMGDAATDRTLEIADERVSGRQPLRDGADQWMRAALMAWVSTGRWARTLLRVALPSTAPGLALLLEPALAPVARVARCVSAFPQRPAARQTHPPSAGI